MRRRMIAGWLFIPTIFESGFSRGNRRVFDVDFGLLHELRGGRVRAVIGVDQ